MNNTLFDYPYFTKKHTNFEFIRSEVREKFSTTNGRMVKKEKLRKTVKKKAIQRSLMNLMMDQVQSLWPDPIAKN